MSFWCERAWLPPGVVAERVSIETASGRIAAVTPGVDPPDGAVRLRGLVVAGFADVHSHAFHRALRGHTHAAGGDFWSWRELMYMVADRLDPDSYRDLAVAVFAEMVLAGITCVGEFHYLHHDRDGRRYADPNAMGAAVLDAAAQAGVRITLLDTCYLDGGFGRPLQGAQLRFGDGDVEVWAGRVADLGDLRGRPHAKVAAAIHSVRAVGPAAMAAVARWTGERDLPLHVHLSEQVAENRECLERYGRTPAQLLADAGALRPATTAVHATHLTAGDLGLLASSGAGACLCPTTERDLADGIGPARALADDGVALSLGTDSNAVVDMFEEARGVEMDERLTTRRRGHFAGAALLEMATVNGHRALGWPDAGRIEVGARADLVAIDLGSPRTAGTGRGPDAAVFAATAADVTDVVVDGRHVVRDRHHVDVPDVGAALAAAIAAVER
jgi:formiminoglutamate deiminase